MTQTGSSWNLPNGQPRACLPAISPILQVLKPNPQADPGGGGGSMEAMLVLPRNLRRKEDKKAQSDTLTCLLLQLFILTIREDKSLKSKNKTATETSEPELSGMLPK